MLHLTLDDAAGPLLTLATVEPQATSRRPKIMKEHKTHIMMSDEKYKQSDTSIDT